MVNKMFLSEKIKWFAQSSGTTNSISKFIPVSNSALENCHFKAGKDMLVFTLTTMKIQVFFLENPKIRWKS